MIATGTHLADGTPETAAGRNPLADMTAPNATLEKFGYPDSVIAEGRHWAVLLRPAQVTLGALVLVCKEPVTALGEVSREGLLEFGEFSRRLETALRKAFDYDKINYLLLMMVDPDVHFHVLPRYGEERHFAGSRFEDFGWPGPPTLDRGNEVGAELGQAIRRKLLSTWPGA